MKDAIIAIVALGALAAPTFAEPPSPDATKPADAFTQIDTDKSGALSLTEIKLVDVSVTQADFDKHDADKSASISKAEFDMWQAKAKDAKAGTPG